MAELLERLGSPQDHFLALHVAGTRGKGSTCALLAAALEASDLPAGLTTSPHLVHPRERLRLRDRDASVDELRQWVGAVRAAARELEPSYFETLVAASFLAFAERGIPLAVVEVGLGGRLDATVLCRPVVTAITRLGLEHRDRLGDTLAAIAREKAGILAPGVPALLAPNAPEAVAAVREVAARVGARLRELEPAELSSAPRSGLPGPAQSENAALAWAILEELSAERPEWGVSREQAEMGFQAVRWPARLDLRRTAAGRSVLVDVAHDAESLRVLISHVEALGLQPATMIFTCLGDKDLSRMASSLAASPGLAGALVLVPELAPGPRTRPAAEVVAVLIEAGLEARRTASVEAGLEEASTRPGPIVACGSFSVAGPVLACLDQAGPDPDPDPGPDHEP